MNDRAIPHPVLFRLVLVAIGAVQLVDGLYALLAPRSFYDDFPLDRGWVAALPSYSEHLVRDVGGLFLATGAVLIFAAVWLERKLVWAALISWLLFAVPHATFHLFNLEPYDTADAVANSVGLGLMVLLPLVLVALLLLPRTAEVAVSPTADR